MFEVATLILAILSMIPASAQSTATTTGPAFEAATVKPNTSGEMSSRIGVRAGGRIMATNVTLKNLIMYAYQVKEFQVSGGPGWIDADRFDVNAVGSENVPADQVQRMLQSLLEERFALKIKRTTKESDVLVLRVAKGGAKLQAVQDDGTDQGFRMDVRRVYSNPVGSLSGFASILGDLISRIVVDKTELPGLYTIDLRWGKSATEQVGPSIFTAIEEQLGLHLESEKQPVESY